MPEAEASTVTSAAEPESGPRRWTLRQRIVLSLIVAAGYSFIRLLGPTLRFSVSYGMEHKKRWASVLASPPSGTSA